MLSLRKINVSKITRGCRLEKFLAHPQNFMVKFEKFRKIIKNFKKFKIQISKKLKTLLDGKKRRKSLVVFRRFLTP